MITNKLRNISIQLLVCLLCSSISVPSIAEKNILPYPPEKNQVQVLPQVFEYELMDSERLRVGDVLIDSQEFKFDLVSNGRSYYLNIRWPVGFFSEGTLSIKNSAGQNFWSKEFTKKQIKVINIDRKEGEETLRNELAELKTENLTVEMIEDLKVIPFIRVCLNRTNESTKVDLCSRELYISSQDGALSVKPRKNTRKGSAVEINGKPADPQGLIYLNDAKESLEFRALAESGTSLVIETKLQPVDLEDLVLSEDEQGYELIASGAQAVDASQVKILTNTADDKNIRWKIQLPKERPIIYLKGGGDIPFKQEFLVRHTLPKPNWRATTDSFSKKTYGSSYTLNVKLPKGAKLSAKQEKSSARAINKSEVSWTLEELKHSQLNRRYLRFENNENKYAVRYQLERGLPFQALLGLRYETPSGMPYAQVRFDWWIESFLGYLGDFRWGLGFDYVKYLSKNTEYPDVDSMGFELMYRFNQGFLFEEETWGLGLPFYQLKAAAGTATAAGVSILGHRRWNAWLTDKIKWHTPKFTYLSGGGTDFKFKGGFELSDKLYFTLSEKSFYFAGAYLKSWSFDPAFTNEKLQIGIDFGLSYFF